jgi:hypothetical protein
MFLELCGLSWLTSALFGEHDLVPPFAPALDFRGRSVSRPDSEQLAGTRRHARGSVSGIGRRRRGPGWPQPGGDEPPSFAAGLVRVDRP